MRNTNIFMALLLGGIVNAQINVQSPPNVSIDQQNPFLDASKYNSFGNTIGKGLYFPKTDLTTWEFKTNAISARTFKSYFDGMIVYNSGTGMTVEDTAKGGQRVAVTPGFYYFKNPNQNFPTGSITNGKWVRLGGEDTSKWTNDTAKNVVKLTNLSDGTTPRTDDKNVFINDNGYVGVGRQPMMDLDIAGKDGINAEIRLTRYNDSNNGANVTIQRATGSASSPGIPAAGQSLGRFRVGAYTNHSGQDSEGFDGFASSIETFAAGVPSSNGNMPTNMILSITNTNGSRNGLLKLQSDAGVGVGFGRQEDVTARLHIKDWNDVTLTSTKNALLIGKESGLNLVFDANEIMARNNGAASTLVLQAQGGDVIVNGEDTDVKKRFYFRSNTGNVGIGVATPSEKLEVAGNIKSSSLAGTGDRMVVADQNGVLKTSQFVMKATDTNATCSDANEGAIHYKTIMQNGKKVGVFGFCTRDADGNLIWSYNVGGNNFFSNSGTGAFGSGL